jgi:hypothetical protein
VYLPDSRACMVPAVELFFNDAEVGDAPILAGGTWVQLPMPSESPHLHHCFLPLYEMLAGNPPCIVVARLWHLLVRSG